MAIPTLPGVGIRKTFKDPLAGMTALQHEVNCVFDQWLDHLVGTAGARSTAPRPAFEPPVDVTETDDAVKVLAELAGLGAEDVRLELDNQTVIISGVKRAGPFERGEVRHAGERLSGDFRRVIPLPAPVHEEQVAASLAGGLLTIRLRKTACGAPAAARRIPIGVCS